MNPNGVYWTGQDGNYYIKTPTSGGVQNMGYAGTTNPNSGVISRLSQIRDPALMSWQNPGMQTGADGAAPATPSGSSVVPQSSGASAAQQQANAAAAAKAAQDAKINSVISAGTQGALAGGDSGAAQAAQGFNQQGQQLYNTTQAGQNTIDQARKSIGMNQINSIKDLMNTIKQGLQGTGVQLANTNALDSSAAGAAARAYANYGNVETNKVNNTAANANEGQDVQQTNLNLARQTGMDTLKGFRDSSIKTIQDQATQALSGLANTVAFLGGDAGKIDVNGIRDQIIQNAQNQLGLVDQHISSMVNGVQARGADDIAHDAYASSNAGVVPSGPALPFQQDNPTAAAPASFGGAPNSLIPLALKPRTAS